jgi:predicted site-specific integrase-resolvase
MKGYLKGAQASEKLGIHQRTLYQWEMKGWIKTLRTPGGIRYYDVDGYIKNKECEKEKETKKEQECIETELKELDKKEEKLNICYVRVSTHGQKSELENQKKFMEKMFPNYEMIEDIGSGINFNRKGLRKIIDLAIEGKINMVVVANRDRLTRFGFDFISDLIQKYSNGRVIVLNEKEVDEPEIELAKDVLQIMNVFVAKMNGLRRYKTDEQSEEIL